MKRLLGAAGKLSPPWRATALLFVAIPTALIVRQAVQIAPSSKANLSAPESVLMAERHATLGTILLRRIKERREALQSSQVFGTSSESIDTTNGTYKSGILLEWESADIQRYGRARSAFQTESGRDRELSLVRLSLYLGLGIGGPKDSATARKLCIHAIKAGNVEAYYLLPVVFEIGEVAAFSGEFHLQFAWQVESRWPAACYLAGKLKLNGTSPALLDAYRLFAIAADGESGLAWLELAKLRAARQRVQMDSSKLAIIDHLVVLLSLGETGGEKGIPELDQAGLERVSEILLDTAWWGYAPSYLAICRAILQTPNIALEDAEVAAIAATAAVELGVSAGAFYAAKAMHLLGNEEAASLWIRHGQQAEDWRCRYCAMLVKDDLVDLASAIDIADRGSFSAYAAITLSRQAPAGVVAPIPLNIELPVLTPGNERFASDDGILGLVQFVVNIDGSTTGIQISKCSNAEVARELTKAVEKWTFTPAKVGDRSVPVVFSVPVATFSGR